MRIKICGITKAHDARAASQAGADLIGVNFFPPSPRYAGDGSVAELLAAVEPPTVAVAVTVNPARKLLEELIAPGDRVGEHPFRVVQFSGDEPARLADYLADRQVKVIKAFRVAGPEFVDAVRGWVDAVQHRDALLAILLDAPPEPEDARDKSRRFGGTGRRFDWNWVIEACQTGAWDHLPPILLAGGLNPHNVAEAVRQVRPWGVDVAGGVETSTVRTGGQVQKSIDKIRDFIRNARRG